MATSPSPAAKTELRFARKGWRQRPVERFARGDCRDPDRKAQDEDPELGGQHTPQRRAIVIYDMHPQHPGTAQHQIMPLGQWRGSDLEARLRLGEPGGFRHQPHGARHQPGEGELQAVVDGELVDRLGFVALIHGEKATVGCVAFFIGDGAEQDERCVRRLLGCL
jgi:hypothetical protein